MADDVLDADSCGFFFAGFEELGHLAAVDLCEGCFALLDHAQAGDGELEGDFELCLWVSVGVCGGGIGGEGGYDDGGRGGHGGRVGGRILAESRAVYRDEVDAPLPAAKPGLSQLCMRCSYWLPVQTRYTLQ